MSHLYATLSSFRTPTHATFLVGMSDAGYLFHAYQLYLVSVLHDSQETRVQLLSSITRTNHVHDRTIPYYKMTAIVELLSEMKKVITYLESKNFYIPVENVRLLTDSECSLIWARILCTRFKIGVQTLITKLTLTLFDLNLCPFKNLNFIDQTAYKFPVDALTKLNPKESFKTIQDRHQKLRECDWLNSKDSLLEVINNPWIPKHKAKTYMQEAEPLTDFKYLLE